MSYSFIRSAEPGDAPALAQLIVLAMGSLAARFTCAAGTEEEHRLFEKFSSRGDNQYSYQNMIVYEHLGKVVGMACAYNGAELERLRAPFISYLRTEYGFEFALENETQAGETYLDCIAVFADMRGKGIAKMLIRASIEKTTSQRLPPLGLLVNIENRSAHRLYETLGFKAVGEKMLLGTRNIHMQYQLD